MQQIPLPIPKNVVLICMMEAAERHQRETHPTNGNSDEAVVELIDDTNGSMNASDEDEEFDLNRIISGMATFSGPCGTYVVKERNGLSVLNHYPHPTNDDDHEDGDDEEEDDDHDEESRNDDVTSTTAKALHVTASYDSIEVSNPCRLKQGQTVQVVRYENGIATLARDAGYIRATTSQLVKGKINHSFFNFDNLYRNFF